MKLCQIASLDKLLYLVLGVESYLVHLVELSKDVLRPNDFVLCVIALELVEKINHLVMIFFKYTILIQ